VTPDYVGITETPADEITEEALSMAYSRYAWARSFAAGKHVLEVGCGAGQGLGYLAEQADLVVGADISQPLLSMAQSHYGGRARLIRLDGQHLPFHDRSFDVVLLFEALYYLPHPERFLAEAARVLRPNGAVLLSTVNPEWRDHLPSAFSHSYHSAGGLRRLINAAGLAAEVHGGFEVPPRTVRQVVMSGIKRTAMSLDLIPKTMRGKRLLKRLFLGRLVPVWRQVRDGIAPFDEPRPISSSDDASRFRVLYAVGRQP
jgi:SAM-dependent methyltransferase